MSIDESTDLINLIAKLIPEETSTIFSESDYVIDLSSWFQDSITQEKVSVLHKTIKNKNCIYKGYSNFIEKQAVCDSGIITANGTASLEFAREIMLCLNIKPVEKIYEWYKFNKLGFYQK